MKIKNPYKIHGLSTANADGHQANSNQTFYKSSAGACTAAERMAREGNSVVIYKAISVFQPVETPVIITPIEIDDV